MIGAYLVDLLFKLQQTYCLVADKIEFNISFDKIQMK